MKLMLPKAYLPGLLLLILVSLPLPSQAYTMYLSLTGISGEATNGLIAIDSFQTSESVPITVGGSGGGSAGKVSFSDMVLTKQLDVSSPVLAVDCAIGKDITTAILTVVDPATGNTLYTITLGNVLVSAIATSGNGDRPTESVSLNFQTIEWKYQQLDATGNKVGTEVIGRVNLSATGG